VPNQAKLDNLYIDIAKRVALMSHARRSKVGAVIVKDANIISYGWNGTPTGDDNVCEVAMPDGTLVTKPDVLHAESNAMTKLLRSGSSGSNGATLYVTVSPCRECAKLIYQAGIQRVVFVEPYRDTAGIQFLLAHGVSVEQHHGAKEEPSKAKA
jgi:dCMP deaminase